MKEIDILAERTNLPRVLEFVDGELEALDCGIRIITQIDVAVEEIFVNISSYAYDPSVGPAEVRCEVLEDPMRVIIQFLDGGKPFDPLAKEDADTSEEALMSRIGGLGILLVKETMDDVSYEYKDGQNILTILKNL